MKNRFLHGKYLPAAQSLQALRKGMVIVMKRLIALLLCICIILSGCKGSDKADSGNTGQNGSNADNTNSAVTDVGGNNSSDESMVSTLLKLNESWSLVKAVELALPEFTLPAYKAEVKPYKIAEDLSNVENMYRFEGFTGEQREQLARNGFIVMPSNYTKSYYVYENNEYTNIPSFISSDVILHIYHQFYDKSLMFIESKFMYEDLDMMTRQMLDKAILLYEKLQDEELKALQRKNIAYFMTARMLFMQTTDIGVTVDADITELALREYELAQAAESIYESPILGHDIDYSQFTVRGHYTRTDELTRFFKTMMWFGLIPFELVDDDGNIVYDNVYRALLIAYMTVADSPEICDAKLWSDIYEPTSGYVGLSDDINVFTMNGLRLAVFESNLNPDSYNDDQYNERLTKAVDALPRPRIQAKTVFTTMKAGLQFRFMGQRYILDSEILQELMEPILRPVPTALDVMGVLGSKTAEGLLLDVYKPQEDWPGYTDKFNKLKNMVKGYDKSYWQSNLYNGWLWSIQSVLKEYAPDSGMPFFMTTEAWKYKSLNAALGSYTELKHDSVLYGKQAVAEMGGPIEDEEVRHYVEPDIELYAKLKYLTEYTCSVLNDKGMLSGRLKDGADSYTELLQLLINCSIKELRNESLTKEENRKLLFIGGTMENIITCFEDWWQDLSDYATVIKDPTDMLVTDIATVVDETGGPAALSLGTGYFDDIFVIVPNNDKLCLARGCSYSFYEFLSNKRLTDEDWWRLQGITVVHEEYADYIEMNDPSKELPEQPDWVSEFKDDKNFVNVIPLEIDWDKLAE